LNEDPQNSENIDERIWEVISKSISKDPSKRYQSINEMLNDLNEVKAEIKTVNATTSPGIKNIAGVPGNKRKLFIAAAGIVLVVVLAAVYFLWIKSPSSELSSTEKKMIVVLPFANIGNELEQEYFADGMTDEMITILGNANPERLGVIGRTSAMHYKERDVTIENIGQELGVGYILEGSVRRQGEQVRIAVNLIQVEDKTQLWSRTFDGTMNEIFVLQNDVANQIAEALAVELLQGSYLTNRTHTPDPQAYEEYLTGRFFAHKGTEESWRKAINYYEEAVRIDPEFALAYAALSHAYSAWATWNTISPKIAYDKAKAAVDEAFRLNPNLADAHSALAFIAMFFEWNWQKAEEQFLIALELNPSDGETYHFYGHYLSFMNREDESIVAFKNALNFDPLSALHRNCMGNTYLQMEEFKLAENSITKAMELSPELQVGYYILGLLRERQNRMEEAIVAWEKAVQYSDSLPTYLGVLGYGYGKSGQTEKAKAILKELELKSRVGYGASMDIAKVYAGLGDNDRAFEILEETFNNREPWIFGLKVAPGFDTIRDDPRFTDLLRRIGVEP
jgi:TolB-like protein/Tfp pilus assembly protein PilF